MSQSKMIGSRLKKERLKQNMTLKQLSEKVGLSIGYLSQVERGYGTLSLNALKKLSASLGVEMSTFFDEPEPEEQKLIVRSWQRDEIQLSKQFVQYTVCHSIPKTSMRGLILELTPTLSNQEKPHYAHPEEEILYVLEGSLILKLGETEHLLHPGDCAHIPANMEHSWRNPTNHIVKLFGTYLVSA